MSRESVQASAELLKSLREKFWDTLEILAPRPSPASLDPVIVGAAHFRIVVSFMSRGGLTVA